MKKYISLLVVAMAASTGYSYAQYAGDALRFSQTNYGSSARFKGMGNAQIGTGGDISSLGGNPAGLGLFTKSEFTFTPEFNSTSLDANYLNSQSKTDKSQINLNQIGAVFYMPVFKAAGSDTKKGLVSGVIGLGYNRNNDYGLETNYGGINTQTSVYNVFGDYTVAPNSTQAVNAARSGGVSEFNIAGALNISNQFYIGASLGLVNLRYNYDSMLDEDGLASDYYVNYNQNQSTRGSGVNGRLGIIFRPIPELRLGANLQTPTWFTIDEDYSETSNDRDLPTDGSSNFSYNLRTPLKGSLGASYVIGTRALISADVDFVDYTSIRFSSVDGGDMNTITNNNNDVRRDFNSAINYRVGAEVKLTDLFSLRAGYGMNGSAYKDDDNDDFSTKFYSGGLGYRTNAYYVDLAYQRVETMSTFSPYILPDFTEPVASATNAKNNVFLTVGLRF